jgi:ribonucleoside-diphosphate reductase alpha chain
MPALTSAANVVLHRRYLQQDETGTVVETPDEMFRRVAATLAEAEAHHGGDAGTAEDRFYEVMRNLDFLPNSPTLMNAGTDLQQLAACFVLPIEDSLSSIFETLSCILGLTHSQTYFIVKASSSASQEGSMENRSVYCFSRFG